MRHRKAGTKLGRTTSHRKAMMRNMVTSLFEHDRVVTTEAKAKAVKPMAEKIITLAKRGDLHARRQALAVLTKKSVTHRLFSEIKERYIDRAGGFTSIVKIGPRRGDAAPMAVLQLIKPEEQTKSKKKKGRKKKAAKKADAPVAKAAKKEPAPVETKPEVKPEEEAPPKPEAQAEPEETAEPEVTTETEAEVSSESTDEQQAESETAASEETEKKPE